MFQGSIVALITPFKNGAVDEDAFQSLVEWQIEEGTVRDVMARLPRGRELAYTSVSTVLRILEDKKLVRTRRQGRGHLYRPAITKSEYESRSVRNLVDKVFEGAPSAMVMRLLDDEELTLDQLEKIRRLFEEKLQ